MMTKLSIVPIQKRVDKLLELMKKYSLNAYIIPSEDAHQSEYITVKDKRREYISGFTGSSGCAVITDLQQPHQQSLLWTDGRYWLQADKQLDPSWKVMKDRVAGEPTVSEWLSMHLKQDSQVGVDPRLISKGYYDSMVSSFKKKNIKLVVDIKENLIDCVRESFKDQEEIPEYPKNPVFFLQEKYSGQSSDSKIQDIRKEMAKVDTKYMVVSALDEIAWALNLRGSDISFNPVFLSYLVIGKDNIILFIDESKLSQETKSNLPKGTEIQPYNDVFPFLESLKEKDSSAGVWIDPRSSFAIFNSVAPNQIYKEKSNPILLAKSIKNQTEIQGFRNCHIRDASALIEYLAWLEEEIVEKNTQTLNEYTVAEKLESFRKSKADFVSLSFDTISSINSNGAIIHYKPEPETCLTITKGMYLVDSGGQYLDGTTDVTRTLHYGAPTQHEIDCYTRVLKGHLGISLVKFPNRCSGRDLDTIARVPLWEVGLDFAHGTGHGVGSFLNVHEGPQGISFRNVANPAVLQPGMTLTNEPGYYESGAFGIRIENVMITQPVQTPFNNGTFLGFENVTLVPYERKLINLSMLNAQEIALINQYYQEIREKVLPTLSHNTKAHQWLLKNTQSL
ncbi:hypothetical protein CYY_001007 [Polysphondylium violaceum]|uniref:Peptidase M24 family protein n=1 Tax=Polysphondylium violaceum TaxID=133409 RepID=A0A8J4Q0S7_9MYCE|nr:hypothetical protein CYY_001007 [Polysphondylium violaceum]